MIFWSVKLTFTLLFGVAASLSTLDVHWKNTVFLNASLLGKASLRQQSRIILFASQVINKMITNHSKVNKTLPKISCEKVIDFWLSSYVKLASKSVPKSIKNEPWLPFWSSVGPNWLPESPPNCDPFYLPAVYLDWINLTHPIFVDF